MDLDIDRWHRLRAAAADAVHDGPTFVQVQEANDRRARARDQLEHFKASGPQGRVGGSPPRGAHAGEQILAGIGATSADDITRAFRNSVTELEARVAEAEREAKRLADRLHQCSERRNGLSRLIEAIRSWAAEQSIRLPGDETGQLPPVITVRGPPPGTHDFLRHRAARCRNPAAAAGSGSG